MISEALNGKSGVVLDPFAGSGTTLGEALRLGHRAIGVEINPYAAATTAAALGHRPDELRGAYERIVEAALGDVKALYGGSKGPAGYFWGYEVDCAGCGGKPLLLHRNLLVKHAYPDRHPAGWALCPVDRRVIRVPDVSAEAATCNCGERVSLKPRRFGRFTCCFCESTLSPGGEGPTPTPPRSVLVAVERYTGSERTFEAPSEDDLALIFPEAHRELLSAAPIPDGHSTEQLLRWGFRDWRDLFHARQARLAHALASRVSAVDDAAMRRNLALTFSPFLEYHCRLASFKGLGTGSVRQAFGRPILHPVSISYEINPVSDPDARSRSGDPRSWYGLRIGRADEAFRSLLETRGTGVRQGSPQEVIAGTADVAVLCGDSGAIDLAPGSVDAVVTDPPYFDRVHYDDLAGPLNAWMSWCNAGQISAGGGIQGADRDEFAEGLHRSLAASLHALRTDGILTFTYHHDRIDAWVALAEALSPLPVRGLSLVLAPAEMPNALIKQRARRPIACDALLTFVKGPRHYSPDATLDRAVRTARDALSACEEALPGDVRSAAFASGVLVGLAGPEPPGAWPCFLEAVVNRVEQLACSTQ